MATCNMKEKKVSNFCRTKINFPHYIVTLDIKNRRKYQTHIQFKITYYEHVTYCCADYSSMTKLFKQGRFSEGSDVLGTSKFGLQPQNYIYLYIIHLMQLSFLIIVWNKPSKNVTGWPKLFWKNPYKNPYMFRKNPYNPYIFLRKKTLQSIHMIF